MTIILSKAKILANKWNIIIVGFDIVVILNVLESDVVIKFNIFIIFLFLYFYDVLKDEPQYSTCSQTNIS